MNSTYTIQQKENIYYLYNGEGLVKTPDGAIICTKSKEFADNLLADVIRWGEDWESPFSLLSYHGVYCDYTQNSDDVNTKEEFEEVVYGDDFWGVDEPIQIRAAVVSKYKDWLPEHIISLPMQQQAVYVIMACFFGSVILTHRIVKALLEDFFYIANDMTEFIEELDQYGLSIGFMVGVDEKIRIDLYNKIVKTIHYYYTLEEI